MAKGKANIEAIEGFKTAVDSSKMEVLEIEQQVYQEISAFNRESEEKLRTLDGLVSECSVAKHSLESQMESKRKELEGVEQQLAVTPATVKVTKYDNDGNPYEEKEPNPVYYQLLGRVNSLSNEIQILNQKKRNIERAERKAVVALELIIQNMNMIEQYQGEMRGVFPQIYDKYERCYMLSSKALEIVNEYSSMNLDLSSDIGMTMFAMSGGIGSSPRDTIFAFEEHDQVINETPIVVEEEENKTYEQQEVTNENSDQSEENKDEQELVSNESMTSQSAGSSGGQQEFGLEGANEDSNIDDATANLENNMQKNDKKGKESNKGEQKPNAVKNPNNKKLNLKNEVLSEIQAFLYMHNIKNPAEVEEVINKCTELYYKAVFLYNFKNVFTGGSHDAFETAISADSMRETFYKFRQYQDKTDIKQKIIDAKKILQPTFDPESGWREKVFYKEMKRLINSSEVNMDFELTGEQMKLLKESHTLHIGDIGYDTETSMVYFVENDNQSEKQKKYANDKQKEK